MRQDVARLRLAPRALILAVLVLAACGTTIDTTFDDAAITARVRRALLNDPIVRGLPVTVETRARVVTLTAMSAAQPRRHMRLPWRAPWPASRRSIHGFGSSRQSCGGPSG